MRMPLLHARARVCASAGWPRRIIAARFLLDGIPLMYTSVFAVVTAVGAHRARVHTLPREFRITGGISDDNYFSRAIFKYNARSLAAPSSSFSR